MTASIHVRVLRKSCGWLKPCCPCCMSNICHFSVLVLFNCQLAGCWINSYISTPDSLSLYRQPCQNTVVCACCCARQGYGLFLYLWQFFIPLVIFVVAYWKILGVVHRQEKWILVVKEMQQRTMNHWLKQTWKPLHQRMLTQTGTTVKEMRTTLRLGRPGQGVIVRSEVRMGQRTNRCLVHRSMS